jgi:hypothetical protein
MKKFITPLIILICLSILAIRFQHPIKNKLISLFGIMKHKGRRINNADCTNCDILFNDGINAHEKAYKHEGIKEQQTAEGLIKLGKKNELKNIENIVKEEGIEEITIADEAYRLKQTIMIHRGKSSIKSIFVQPVKYTCLKSSNDFVAGNK